MSEQEERVTQLTAEKNDLENTHPMAAKLLQDGNYFAHTRGWIQQNGDSISKNADQKSPAFPVTVPA